MHNLCGYEIFRFDFYGVLVFLCVGRVYDDEVTIYELETVQNDDDTVSLIYDYKNRCFKSKKPADCLIVPVTVSHNTHMSSSFRMVPINLNGEDSTLQIDVEFGDRVYNEALRINKFPDYEIIGGSFLAEQISDGSNKSYDELIHTHFELITNSNICIEA